ncbi:inositol 1,3,4-trisphosphate 5/6-kinase 4 isoform X2 [Malania oleifera]|uniref:inositol 1,3,4-trisphosphate 5/6-kinase 4 isoform X2 n=1 Tax=Malania oleifera TaxID=397392 RepID=UPI0025ADEAD4|nr:inositol 1,3,4-trisphosphate 5/6-kinase 4 isoform X2 [Malania oleifera]
MVMGKVGGIILDESVVFGRDDENGNASVLPAAEYLLRKLRHSSIPTGISYGLSLSTHKMSLLKRTAKLHSCDCFSLDASSLDNALNGIGLNWGDAGGIILYLVSNDKKDVFLKMTDRGWLIIVPNVEGGNAGENSSLLYIKKLEELPLTICRLNKKAVNYNVVTVGFIMKPSREEDFAKRGAFPMRPTENGLIFMPLTFDLPISSQLEEIDVILHKATDEIISVELSSSSEFADKVTFTRGMNELERYMAHYPDFCSIDPLKNIYPVLDRLKIQQILHDLEDLNKEGCKTIRGPHFLKIDDFNEPDLGQRLLEANLTLPSIVKPQIACGVADAHSMAIVFKVEDYKDLSTPLPAVVQEYVDHSSSIFKFYVLGERVFYAAKKSTPNADVLMKLSEKHGFKPLVFDSLKSLPIDKENQNVGDGVCSKDSNQFIDLDLVTDAAIWLRRRLDLTIFGFDVVVQEGSGDHVIVDVNYLPSFKEVPDTIAIPAFWDAIKSRFESLKTKQAMSLPPTQVNHFT